MPPLAIILLTYARTDYAIRTVRAIHENLVYAGAIKWIVADDGSPQEHVEQVVATVGPNCVWRSKRVGYGANANWAWGIANSENIPVTLWLEDDWVLPNRWNITPYVDLLIAREDVGIVRLGHMPINLDLSSHGYDGRMYLEVHKNKQYAFSGNPHLKHKRMADYGQYAVGKNPGDTEIAYDHMIRTKQTPAIWWPLAIGDTFPFAHIGDQKSY